MSTENTEVNVPEVSEPPVEEAARPGAPEELQAELQAELHANLQAEVADLQDRLLRRQAEFENYRRRVDRDRSDFLQYAGMEVVRELLPVVDDFERALKIESSDVGYRKGVELIYQRLLDSLQKIGLEPIESTIGNEFDPNLHQAVVRFETDEAADGTILEEFQRGYNFKGKLLRPAMVRVAVHPSS